MGTPLIINEEVRSQIRACMELAKACPVDMTTLGERFKDPVQREQHRAQMQRQTIGIPLGLFGDLLHRFPLAYSVTYSIEHGQPCGPCRHLSMSVNRAGRVPNEVGLWMVAAEFGFWGALEDCEAVWNEELSRGGTAINIVQRFAQSS